MYTFAGGNFGQKSAKVYTENSQVQKGYEFFYLGSKTTSSTTVLTSSPKKIKSESDLLINSTTNNSHFFPTNIVIAEETEYSASPNPHTNTNLDNTNTNLNLTNTNLNIYNNSTEIKFVTKANFTKKYQSMVQNPNAKEAAIINCSNNNNNNLNSNNTQGLLQGNSGSSAQGPQFNYGKFQESIKLKQFGSANSLDSNSNNLINASTSDSPGPFNNAGSLDVKPSCYNSLNLFFSDDHFRRNNFRNNCKAFFFFFFLKYTFFNSYFLQNKISL
jgi:hypothetical protein